MFIFFSLVTDVFLTTQNLQNRDPDRADRRRGQGSFVLLCAEIDLSIASVATFTGVLAAWFWVGDTIALGNWGFRLRSSSPRRSDSSTATWWRSSASPRS